ncbi:MAG TPA: DUF58 domain-containing protein [Planctomycetota bacterium]|nr:DUF58 domain-containing protein [Planctomycetota bacterium]
MPARVAELRDDCVEQHLGVAARAQHGRRGAHGVLGAVGPALGSHAGIVACCNEVVHCPRPFHLFDIGDVPGLWVDDHCTVEGGAVHRRVDVAHVVCDAEHPTDDDRSDDPAAADGDGPLRSPSRPSHAAVDTTHAANYPAKVPVMNPFRPSLTPAPAVASNPAESLAEVLAEVRRIEVQSNRLVTDVLAGGYRSTFRGTGIEFADVREYVEGDDPRSIDWNVTARVGRPFVKRFVEERERTIVFALDLSASMRAGFGAWSLRQTAARFAACLGLAAIGNNDRVGLIAGSTDVERFVLPKKGAGHVLRLVRDCLVLQGRAAGTELGALVAHASAALRRRTVVFLMSDFLSLGHEHALALAARRHDLVAVRLTPRELLDPPAAMLRTVDPESGRVRLVDLGSPRVRSSWLRRCARWRARADEVFGRARIDCIDIEVPAAADITAISQPILRFFRRRELREAKR